MYNAIFYDGMYLLLPEEFQDYDTFIQDLRKKTLPAQYQMVRLLEDHHARNFTVIKGVSIAPYFLSGYHDEPAWITIEHPEDVYPVEAEVMDQSVYNTRLREVINRVCPGCVWFKPLSNRVQSLNRHFEEMSLDGLCVFRQESKPAPRSFHHHLFSFGGFFRKFNFAARNATEIHDKIKQWFYIRYADATLNEENGQKTLTLYGKKNELLSPILTGAISRYVDKISEGTYHIRLAEKLVCTEETLSALLSEENAEAFRKACKKYGVSLAILTYDEHAAEKIRLSLKPLIDHFWLFPLVQTAGKEYFLVADTPHVLKALRYRSPLLQTYHATVDSFGQDKNTRYQISFAMKQIPI